jgi:hypothetical protein
MRRRSGRLLVVGIMTCGAMSAGGSFTAGIAGASVTASGPVAAHVSVVAPSWRDARQLPGLAALARGSVEPDALSCGSADDCVLGGSYTGAGRTTQAFVAGETNDVWDNAIEVPGLGALNKGGSADVTSVSCAAPGDCAAAGRYSPGGMAAGSRQPSARAFVADEKNGVWRDAVPVPGLAARDKGRSAKVSAVSCWSPGDCAAAGTYAAAVSGRDVSTQAFVVGEWGGVWGTAAPLPGLIALNVTGLASVSALSCAPAGPGRAGGYCAVGGQYGGGKGTEAFVSVRSGGTWHPAREYPGTAVLNSAGAAGITSVSCPAAGGCAVAGSYAYKTGGGTESGTAFVADQKGGRWGAPHVLRGAVPGTVVSCGSPGDCAAGGTATAHGDSDGFVATERGGRWGNPRSIPGLAGLDAGHDAAVVTVSCPAAGACGAGGSYADSAAGTSDQAFVVAGADGNWPAARPVPGLATPGTDDASVTQMSCRTPLACTAAGFDDNGDGIFVAATANGGSTRAGFPPRSNCAQMGRPVAVVSGRSVTDR